MEISGKFVQLVQEKRGVSASGNDYAVGGFVMETDGEYPKNIAFQVFGEEKLNRLHELKVGEPISVTFSLESREYPSGSNKWFSTIKCISYKSLVQIAAPPQPLQSSTETQYTPKPNDDLPF